MNRLKTHSSVTSHASLPIKVSCQYKYRKDKPPMVEFNSLQLHPYEHHMFFQVCLSVILIVYKHLDTETHPESDDSSQMNFNVF